MSSFKSSSYLNTNAGVANTNTASFPRISAGTTRNSQTQSTARSQKSDQSRIRQIILSNKKSLNNAVDTIAKQGVTGPEQSSETFASFSKMPQIDSQVMYRGIYGAGTDSMLIKSPFKQSAQARHQLAAKGGLSQPGTSSQNRLVNSAKTVQSCQLRPINGLDNFSQFNVYNPSTSLILKTANSINEFVDFFEKNRNQTTSNIHRPRGIRLSRYSGLKPLNCVKPSGPAIKNCLGVVIEPKVGENSLQLRDVYEQKLKQLAHKRAIQSRTASLDKPDLDTSFKMKSRLSDLNNHRVATSQSFDVQTTELESQ